MSITSQLDSNSKMSLIGALKFYNGWICLHGNKVKVINPHRVEETILFRELMENHVISSTKLETPLKLDTRWEEVFTLSQIQQICSRRLWKHLFKSMKRINERPIIEYKVENIVSKSEIADHEQISCCHNVFKSHLAAEASESFCMCERVNCFPDKSNL